METDFTKRLLGKMLGEIYRVQTRSQNIPCSASEAHIFGLLNGFERALEDELERIGFISEEKLKAVEDILDDYFVSNEKLTALKGFYDIEPRLEECGIKRGEAIQILRYLYADDRFVQVIDKFNSNSSPVECKTFRLSDWDI